MVTSAPIRPAGGPWVCTVEDGGVVLGEGNSLTLPLGCVLESVDWPQLPLSRCFLLLPCGTKEMGSSTVCTREVTAQGLALEGACFQQEAPRMLMCFYACVKKDCKESLAFRCKS